MGNRLPRIPILDSERRLFSEQDESWRSHVSKCIAAGFAEYVNFERWGLDFNSLETVNVSFCRFCPILTASLHISPSRSNPHHRSTRSLSTGSPGMPTAHPGAASIAPPDHCPLSRTSCAREDTFVSAIARRKRLVANAAPGEWTQLTFFR